MSESLEELKVIIDNAPDDASSVDAEGYYIKFSNSSYYCCASKLDSWRRIEKSELLTTRSLSDIKRIIELTELLEDIQGLGFLEESSDSGVSHRGVCRRAKKLQGVQ